MAQVDNSTSRIDDYFDLDSQLSSDEIQVRDAVRKLSMPKCVRWPDNGGKKAYSPPS